MDEASQHPPSCERALKVTGHDERVNAEFARRARLYLGLAVSLHSDGLSLRSNQFIGETSNAGPILTPVGVLNH
jgi:hypothetical protein